MSDRVVFAGWLAESELQALLASPPAPLTWIILEAVDEVEFGAYRGGIEPSKYPRGCAFGDACEMRWAQDASGYHTVMIGDITEPPESLRSNVYDLPTDDFVSTSASYFLWGEWSSNDQRWLEASIPHVFAYPIPQGEGKWRMKLHTKEYVRRANGETEFYRFVGVSNPIPAGQW